MSNIEQVDAILEMADTLNEPNSYYDGIKTRSEIKHPDNIIMLYHLSNTPKGNSINLYHKKYVLNLVLEGPGKVCINDKMFDLVENSLLLLFPFQFHYYTARAAKYKWLIITFDEIEPVPVELRYHPVILSQFGYTLVRKILETYLAYKSDPTQVLSFKLSSCINCLVNEMRDIARLNPVNEPAVQDTKIMLLEKICGYINHHLDESLVIYDLAKKHGISSVHLHKLFSRAMGCGPGEYIRNAKINRSISMLNSRKYLISEIADKCGFSSQAVFCRTFKNTVGVSPSEFCKNNS